MKRRGLHAFFRELVESTVGREFSAGAEQTLGSTAARLVAGLTEGEREVLAKRIDDADDGQFERSRELARQRAESLRRAHDKVVVLPASDRLRVARELSGLSRGEVSAATGMDTTTVAGIEAGERQVTDEQLGSLAEAYDVPEEWLRGAKAPEWLHYLLMFRIEHEYKKVS